MTRLLILGNSHVAALKSAHAAEPGRWPVEVDFLGAPGGALDSLTLQDGALVAGAAEVFERLNGRAVVPLAGYDAVVIAGCEISMFRALSVLRGVIWPGAVAPPEAPVRKGQVLVSRALVEEAVTASLQAALGARLARLIAGGTDAPIVVTQQPNPCWLGEGAAPVAAFLRARQLGYAEEIARIFRTAAGRALAPAVLLPQPPETLRGPVFTRPVFSQGSVRLTREMKAAHDGDDFLHANAAYGALVLDQLVAVLAPAEA
ncbi:hypothetical protein V8J36_18115 [Frigidibacter sp. MR17.14]|uniref:hypothetical protein n=1 Tax=Frigidibacter sp. MR17.14 TaxID=3126509 RepID=UPI00301303DF